MIKKLADRYDELLAEVADIESTIHQKQGEFGTYIELDREKLLTWKVKVKSLLVATCGKNSEHYKEFLESEKRSSFDNDANLFSRMKSVFLAALEDYKGGYLTSLKNLVQAEVFDSELEQASELLSNGYKSAAAVIAGVVLETTLRDMCLNEGLTTGKLDKMNADLVKAGVYNKLMQKRITALADIRNNAAHGNPDEFSEDDVSKMISEIEQFLMQHLS